MLNQVKAIYQNPIANIFLNDEILEAFPQNQKEDKTACQHCFYSIFTKQLAIERRQELNTEKKQNYSDLQKFFFLDLLSCCSF